MTKKKKRVQKRDIVQSHMHTHTQRTHQKTALYSRACAAKTPTTTARIFLHEARLRDQRDQSGETERERAKPVFMVEGASVRII